MNLKNNTMANSSLEKFEAEAEAAKLKVKFAKAVLIMIDAFNIFSIMQQSNIFP